MTGRGLTVTFESEAEFPRGNFCMMDSSKAKSFQNILNVVAVNCRADGTNCNKRPLLRHRIRQRRCPGPGNSGQLKTGRTPHGPMT